MPMSQNITSTTYISVFTNNVHSNNFLIFIEFSSTVSILPADTYVIAHVWCR